MELGPAVGLAERAAAPGECRDFAYLRFDGEDLRADARCRRFGMDRLHLLDGAHPLRVAEDHLDRDRREQNPAGTQRDHGEIAPHEAAGGTLAHPPPAPLLRYGHGGLRGPGDAHRTMSARDSISGDRRMPLARAASTSIDKPKRFGRSTGMSLGGTPESTRSIWRATTLYRSSKAASYAIGAPALTALSEG